jgi:hypothetical protein
MLAKNIKVQIFGNRRSLGQIQFAECNQFRTFSLLACYLLCEDKAHKTIILKTVLYGCETWYLTLMEKHSLMAFDNRVLRRIFGPERDEVTAGRKLQNEELHTFLLFTRHFEDNQIKDDEIGRAYSMNG